MKKIYIFSLLSLIFLKTFGQVPTNGLMAYYPFNGNANDASGNNNHGIQQGGVNFTTATDRFGVAGKAAGFDGVDDYVEVNHSPSLNNYLNTGELTISYWIYPEIGDTRDVFAKRPPSNNGGFLVQANPNQMVYDHDIYTNIGWKNLRIPYSQNEWQHVVFSAKAGDASRVYINGILVGSLSLVGTSFIGTPNNMRFMANTMSLQLFHKGKLSQVRFFSKTLTNSEIYSLYLEGSPPIDITTGLVAHYKMDGNAQDASGNNNHGTQQGGVNFTAATDRFGVAGKAAGFNGTSSFITVPNSSSIQNINSITLNTWVNYATLAADGTIPILDKSNSSTGGQYFLRLYNNGSNSFSGTLNGQHGGLPFSGIQANTWYHLSMVSLNNSFTFYLNGQKIGSVIGTSTAFSNTMPLTIGANPSGILEVLNGSLDDIRIYNRALTDAEVKAIYDLENNPQLNDVKIIALSEPINKNNYTVPREATIHHYYKAVKNSDGVTPIKDVTIVYDYGVFQHNSLPSDSSGLIDLNILVGGLDPNDSNDDWSYGLGTKQVAFKNLLVGSVTGTNAFTPFDITVIDKAEAEDIESGFSFGLAFDAASTPDANDPKINGVSFEAGFSKASVGVTIGPTFSWKELNSNQWEITVGGELGAFAEAEFENEIGFNNVKAGIPNLSVGASITPNLGFKFLLDLNNSDQCLAFAKNIFKSIAKRNENYLQVSNFFDNVLKNKTVTNPFSSNGAYAGVSLGVNANVELGVGMDFSIINFKGYAKELNLGPSFNLSLEGDLLYELKHESTFTDNQVTFSNSFTRGVNGTAGFSIASDLTRKSPKNYFSLENMPIYSTSTSKQNTLTFENHFDLVGNRTGSGFTLETLKDKESWGLPYGAKFRVNYINDWQYSERVIGKILNAYFNNQNGMGNSRLANFMATNRINQLGSIFKNYPEPSSLIGNSLSLHKYVTDNVEPFWTINDINISQKREVTYINELVIPISIPSLKLGEFSYSSWRTYNHKFKDAYFSPLLKRALPTVELPDIISNLEVPNDEPLGVFFNKLKTHVENLSSSDYGIAYNFLKEILITAISNVITLSNASNNGNNNLIVTRKSLSGDIIYNGSIDKKSLNTNTPSIFTFTINPNPQVFNNNTTLNFSYFYPENRLEAITASDTFRVITDVFTLEAKENGNFLTQTPNGNFQINTQFNPYDLTLVSLPTGMIPRVLFRQRGSNLWQDIGAADQNINFNKLGTFAIGVRISNDKIAPQITVQVPTVFNTPNKITVTISDNMSGIDWSGNKVWVNGQLINWNRIGTTNQFEIQISDLPANPENVFVFQIIAQDLAGNQQVWKANIPCSRGLYLNNSTQLSGNVVQFKALNEINSVGFIPENTKLEYKAGKIIILEPGFETKGNYFKAEIGGCAN